MALLATSWYIVVAASVIRSTGEPWKGGCYGERNIFETPFFLRGDKCPVLCVTAKVACVSADVYELGLTFSVTIWRPEVCHSLLPCR